MLRTDHSRFFATSETKLSLKQVRHRYVNNISTAINNVLEKSFHGGSPLRKHNLFHDPLLICVLMKREGVLAKYLFYWP